MMETRNISITLEKAKEWYNGDNGSLKEIALQTFTKDELEHPFTKDEHEEFNFKNIKTFENAVKALHLDEYGIDCTYLSIITYGTKAAAASFKLNIIRKALNKGQTLEFTKGRIWYPYTPAVLPNCESSYGIEVAKVKIGCDTFTLFGGNAYSGTYEGVGSFISYYGEAQSYTSVGFLGCATKEIAEHMGKYFAKEIFEAKYGDFINYTWIE